MAPSLCENCHQRPQSGPHRYCSKTCATQAAVKPSGTQQSRVKPVSVAHHKGAPVLQKGVQLCDYCGQKPKLGNFDYCTRLCGRLANSTQMKQPTGQGTPATKQKTVRVPIPSQHIPAPVPAVVKAARPPAKAPIPQDISSDGEEEEEEEEEEEGEVDTDLDAYPSDSEEEPVAPAPAATHLPTKNTPRGGKPSGQKPSSGTCVIPGCGKSSHVDRNGVRTKYCSIKHQEEAVTLGLETACIMCQRYPQSTSDYFCSSACRNQSMTKT